MAVCHSPSAGTRNPEISSLATKLYLGEDGSAYSTGGGGGEGGAYLIFPSLGLKWKFSFNSWAAQNTLRLKAGTFLISELLKYYSKSAIEMFAWSVKVTVYLHIDIFLQIWIFGLKILVEVWSWTFEKKIIEKD